ncbi:substrate-binding domain-containing protein [Catellatospora paridis]
MSERSRLHSFAENAGLSRRVFVASTVAAALLAAAGCSSPQEAAQGTGGDGAPVKVGLVYSQSGALASYGKQYIDGFKAGLAQATNGTNKVNGRTIELLEADDAGDPAKAVSAAKDLIGKGVKILAGSASSGVALQVAPVAAQDKTLFISGPAATDGVTGINRYTFRSGRQSYQDVLAAKSFIGDAKDKKVVVFAQDSAFGKANEAAVTAVIGGAGAKVSAILVPASATDFTPFASQVNTAKPDLLFVAWAGTTATAMWQALDQQGVLSSTTVVTGLDQKASYPVFGAAGEKISFLSHYFDGATSNDAAKAAGAKITGGLDLFSPDGFNAAQMVVRAITEGGDDVEKMVTALEGWSFDGVKGKMTIRKEDHAMIQPMFQVKLVGSGPAAKPQLVKELAPEDVTPPAVAMKP